METRRRKPLFERPVSSVPGNGSNPRKLLPASRRSYAYAGSRGKSGRKIIELLTKSRLAASHQFKADFVSEESPNKKCFPYATPSIKRDQFRLFRSQAPPESLLLFDSPDERVSRIILNNVFIHSARTGFLG
jgi:hypothetical protein